MSNFVPHWEQYKYSFNTSDPQLWQNISAKATALQKSPCWTRKILGMSPFQALSDNYRARAQSIDLCFAKLVCVSRNWFVFWQTGSCFEKLICVLRNRFVFWETNLCFGKLICVLGNCFVFWEIVLCFGKLICDWPFWATVHYTLDTQLMGLNMSQ